MLATSWLGQLVRPLRRHRSGHGFESRLNRSFYQLLKLCVSTGDDQSVSTLITLYCKSWSTMWLNWICAEVVLLKHIRIILQLALRLFFITDFLWGHLTILIVFVTYKRTATKAWRWKLAKTSLSTGPLQDWFWLAQTKLTELWKDDTGQTATTVVNLPIMLWRYMVFTFSV